MFLSIVIPTYNGRLYIDQCIESAKRIRLNKEIIVVDDGSTDDEYGYMEAMYGKEPDIHILRKKNGGIVDARNFGLKHAHGKYVIFQDHDDVLCAEAVVDALQRMEEDGADLAIWSTEKLLENETRVPCDTVLHEGIYGKEEIREKFLTQMLTNSENSEVTYIGHVWQAVYRMDVIQKNAIRFKRFVDIEDDYLFVFDFLCNSGKLITIQDVGYLHRIQKKSESFRRRVVDDIVAKYHQLYDYVDASLARIGIDVQKNKTYKLFRAQEIYIMSIENVCRVGNGLWRNYKMMKYGLLDRKYVEAFEKHDVIGHYNKKRYHIFWLVKHRFIFAACFYAYLHDAYRMTAGKF